MQCFTVRCAAWTVERVWLEIRVGIVIYISQTIFNVNKNYFAVFKMEFYVAFQQYREPWTIKTVNIDININDVCTLFSVFWHLCFKVFYMSNLFFICWSNILNTQGEKKFQACKHTSGWINYIFIKKLPFVIPWFKVSPHLICSFSDLKSVISVKYSPFVFFMRLVFIFAVLQWTIGGYFTVVTNVQISWYLYSRKKSDLSNYMYFAEKN